MDEPVPQPASTRPPEVRGVLVADLHRFLGEAGTRREELESQLRQAEARVDTARAALSAAVQANSRMGARLLVVQQEAEQVRAVAQAEADVLLLRAEQEAADILAAAHLEVSGVRS